MMQNRYFHPFTLTELMVVVVIIAIILGLVIPAFNSMGTGNAVDAAARMVSAELMHARAEAISQRKKIAVIMPTSLTRDSDDTSVYNYTSFRSAIVTGSATPYTFSDWVSNTEWAFLPTKTCISTIDNSIPPLIKLASTTDEKDEYGPDGYCLVSGDPSYSATDSTVTNKKIASVPGHSGNVRAIIFEESGACPQNYYITIIEQAIDADGQPIVASMNKKNFRVIEINQYTGKARFIY